MNKLGKKIIIIFLIIITTALIIFFIYIKYQDYKTEQLILDIKSRYSVNIKNVPKSNIYIFKNGKYSKVGKIYEELNLNLSKIDNFDEKTKYFNIYNTNYYLYYANVIPTEKNEISKKIPDNYLVFNENASTIDKTIFYNNDTKIIEINEIANLPILYQDEKYYYVEYFDRILSISKDESTMVENINTNTNESSFISILHYDNLDKETIEKNLKYLNENGYYSITIEDYKKWLNNNIRLKEKAILIIKTDNTDLNDLEKKYNLYFENISDSDGIKLSDNNKTTKVGDKLDNLSSYIIKKNNNDEIIKKALNGEDYKEKIIPKKVIPNTNNLNGNAYSIAVLNYHFFYNSGKGEACNEYICLEVSKFEEQLKYLKDNNYKTLTIDEFKKWIYGEIELPRKSVLLTIDDGAMGTGLHNGNILIPLLEKYQINATLFLISAWWSPDNYRSNFLSIQSHTWNMHREGICESQPRGSQFLCASYDEMLNDLEKSINLSDSNTAFCFPFYAYNDTAIKALKEKGFKIAFVGGGYKATRNVDKYKIPRYVIGSDITLNTFISYIS